MGPGFLQSQQLGGTGEAAATSSPPLAKAGAAEPGARYGRDPAGEGEPTEPPHILGSNRVQHGFISGTTCAVPRFSQRPVSCFPKVTQQRTEPGPDLQTSGSSLSFTWLPPLTGSHGGLSLSVPSSFQLNCDPEAASCLVQVHFLSTAHRGHTPVGLVPPPHFRVF